MDINACDFVYKYYDYKGLSSNIRFYCGLRGYEIEGGRGETQERERTQQMVPSELRELEGGDAHLHVAVEGSMVQGRAAAAVGNIDAAQQGDDHLRTPHGLVGGRHVQRGLPVLVPRVDVSRVLNQDLHRLLQPKQSAQESRTDAGSILLECELSHQTPSYTERWLLPWQLASEGGSLVTSKTNGR